MHFSSPLLVSALALFLSPTVALPLSAAQMGSKHNLYLATCTRQTAIDSFTAVAYFADGASSPGTSLTSMSVVNEKAEAWEGAQRFTRLGRDAVITNIDGNAAGLNKSQIAGTARMANEDFVCFRDGETSFSVVVKGQSTGGTISCTADYWCASTMV